jgi:hypothetical protein
MNNYYRKPWSENSVDLLVKWWPHFGTYGMKDILPEISRKQIKAKVNKMKLTLLEKANRLCVKCKTNFQRGTRNGGLSCKECHLKTRSDMRSNEKFTFDHWLKEIVRSCRYRRSNECDIDTSFLKSLWEQQNEKCYYTGLQMTMPEFRKDRNHFSASLDRKDNTLGYLKSNVVWCCWACNVGKSVFTVKDYVFICKSVVQHFEDTDD